MAKAVDSINNIDERAEKWLDLTEKTFNFAKYARARFAKTKGLSVKRDILTLGQDLLLKDRKLTLQNSSWLVPIGEMHPALEKAYLKEVTIAQSPNRKESLRSLTPIVETWRATVEAIATKLQAGSRIRITDFSTHAQLVGGAIHA